MRNERIEHVFAGQANLEVTDAVTAAALDKRLCAMEERLHSVHGEAAEAHSTAKGVHQRIAAAEWRIEKVTMERIFDSICNESIRGVCGCLLQLLCMRIFTHSIDVRKIGHTGSWKDGKLRSSPLLHVHTHSSR